MDFLPTKGFEYLLVIGYLLLLIPFLRFVLQGRTAEATAQEGRLAVRSVGLSDRQMSSWFAVPDGYHYHRGHTWALREGEDVFRVGMSDLAERLLGYPERLLLPPVGSRIRQGEPGFHVAVAGQIVPMLSPLGGEVVEVNQDIGRSPELVCEDPYGRGWLMRIRVPQPEAAVSNLLPGPLARVYLDHSVERLSGMMAPQLGAVLQDGGVPVCGFARELAPESWQRIVREMFLTANPK